MAAIDIETLSRLLAQHPSRRALLPILGGLLATPWLGAMPAHARKKRKKKSKKATLCLDGQTVEASGKKKKQLLKGGATPGACAAPPPPPPPPPPGVPNAYGCLSVDAVCTSAEECCTGICEGGTCRGHGAGTCRQEVEGLCHGVDPTQAFCNNSMQCACTETTGGSKFCGALTYSTCSDCRKDADCVAQGLPAGSACVPFNTGICAGNCESGMACLAPCGTEPPPPPPVPLPRETSLPSDALLTGRRKLR